MNTGKHTPGPWEPFSKEGFERKCYVRATIPGRPDIAFVNGSPRARTYDEQEANARLIAAAPDLLALAQTIAEIWEGTDSPLGKRARELVAKATGEQP